MLFLFTKVRTNLVVKNRIYQWFIYQTATWLIKRCVIYVILNISNKNKSFLIYEHRTNTVTKTEVKKAKIVHSFACTLHTFGLWSTWYIIAIHMDLQIGDVYGKIVLFNRRKLIGSGHPNIWKTQHNVITPCRVRHCKRNKMYLEELKRSARVKFFQFIPFFAISYGDESK